MRHAVTTTHTIPMHPTSELYTRIRADHDRVRALLGALTELASRRGPVEAELTSVLDELAVAMEKHQRLEREGLCASLRARGGRGALLADHLEGMHHYQREWLHGLRRAVLDGRPGLELRVRVFALAQVVGDDLAQEERWLGQLLAQPTLQVA